MLQRFQHVLVPVDFTEKNRAALDLAFELASVNKSRVTLLHVIEEIGDDEDDDQEVQDFYSNLQQRAQSELETMVQRFHNAGLDAEFKVRLGKRVYEIVSYGAERGIDLIVLHSHKIDADHPMQSAGTISYQVSILCECPVLLVK